MRQITCLLILILPCLFAASTHAGVSIDRDIRDDVFYHIMPIAWRDSNNDAARFGDFNGLTASLDYLESLGITAVWINPIFPSPAYHGYQHGAADTLRAEFGTEPEFIAFVEAAHARGIKVFLDFVVYGISHNSIWYQNAYNNPASAYDDWLAFTNSVNTSYLGSTYSTWNGSTVGFIHWNLNNPGPTALVTQWAQKWLDPNGDGDLSDGVDGYRLDHVWENYNSGPNGWGYNIDDFWIPWKQALRTINPNVFTFAEQADWGTFGVELLPGFDATMTKPFEFAARDALSSETSTALYNTMAATVASLPAGKHYMGILGDHDVDRLTSVIGGSLTKAKAAAAILMTQPFTPMIYYGDEIGMLGFKGNFGSDANDIPMREPFKWNAVAGPPMSNYWTLNAAAYNSRYSQNNDGRSVQEQSGVGSSLLEAYRELIAARAENVALRRGAYIPIASNTNRVWSFVRHQPGEQTLFVAIRLRNTTATAAFDLSGLETPAGTTTVRDVLSNQLLANLTDANKAAYSISMPAYTYRILEIDAAPVAPAPNEIDGVDIPDSLGPVSLVATQDNATALGDNISELNQLFVRADADGLRVGITGNLATNGTALALLLDTSLGGQNVLNVSNQPAPPGGLAQLSGLRLDAGFAPDHLFFINTAGGNIYADQVNLPAAAPSTKTYRGQGTANDGDGFLTGGTNPNGLEVAMNNSNALGVTDTDATGADTALHGFDLFIPYADIGLSPIPGTEFHIAAFILRSSGAVSNQWLPGLGGGQPELGLAPDMTTLAGNQFASVALPRRADADCDGIVTPPDVGLFVDGLLDIDTYAANYPNCPIANLDANGDGYIDARDIESFVALVLGS